MAGKTHMHVYIEEDHVRGVINYESKRSKSWQLDL